ncbi:MAG: hypothetical protein DRR19_07005 [Candidatus Parabeggiatoa sp. nov. 1]|nr:MAG: hypothetical protein DRR19_07005 [Gammaproteobacteria bacterium]
MTVAIRTAPRDITVSVGETQPVTAMSDWHGGLMDWLLTQADSLPLNGMALASAFVTERVVVISFCPISPSP